METTFVGPSAVDSDEEDEMQRVHLCARVNVSGSSTHRCRAKDTALPSISSKLYYCGDEPLVLEPGDGAWLPVNASSEFVARIGSTMAAPKLVYFEDGPEDALDVVPGILDDDVTEDSIHLICVYKYVRH